MVRLGRVRSAALLLAVICVAPLAAAKAYGRTQHYALNVQKAKVGTAAAPSCFLACRQQWTGTCSRRGTHSCVHILIAFASHRAAGVYAEQAITLQPRDSVSRPPRFVGRSEAGVTVLRLL